MDSSSQDRRVYVGNLPYDVRWQQLKDFMRQAGEVVRADILTYPNGQSRGCGIVEYATVEEAAAALENLNLETINGRQIYVREDREPIVNVASRGVTRGGIPNTVFVGNLPFSTSWQDLKDLFKQVGTVVRADVHTNLQGRSRGRGIVIFSTPEEVQEAISKFNGFQLDGRALEVREDLPIGERPTPPARAPGSGTSASHSGYEAPNNRSTSNGSRPYFTHGSTAITGPAHSAFAMASGNGSINDTVHISNLPWSTTDQDLLELASAIAPVKQAEIQKLPDGRSAGNGVVQYHSIEDAGLAISQLDGHTYGTLKIVVTYARYPPA